MSRSVCGICFCPYGDDGECACPATGRQVAAGETRYEARQEMNDKTKQALELALEYLRDNQHYIADNERHAYVMEYNAFVERLEALAEQPAQQEQTDWEAVAADQAMTIALMKVQLEGLPGKEQLPWFKDEIPAAYMYDRARYGPTDLRGQQWLPELSRLKPYTGNGLVRGVTPLYTSPPPRKPLTDEQRNWIVATCPTPRHIIDTVEKMHGIKGEA